MELTDAFQRIVRGHWLLIAVCVVLGVVAGSVIDNGRQPSYAASTRVALGTTTPQTEAEAVAISSVAQAIVTSGSQVSEALSIANVRRNADQVAAHDVEVRSLGTSNVVEVVAHDRDAATAQAMANALGTQLERTWLDIGHGQTPQVVKDLNTRLDGLNQQIADLDAQINSTGEPAKGTDPVRTLLARREDLARQAVALETERDRVVSQDATDVRAAIVGRAPRPEHESGTGAAQTIFLGALAGLILGLGLAALIEALRPTLIGSRRIATTAGSALLGRLGRLPGGDENAVTGVEEVATRIRLAATVARVDSVELVAAPGADLEPLAAALRSVHPSSTTPSASAEEPAGALRGGNGRNGHGSSGARDRDTRRPAIRVFDRTRSARGRSAGLVVVSPTRTPASALDEIDDLAAITGWRVLGVVTYDPIPLRRRVAGWFETRPLFVESDEDGEGSHDLATASSRNEDGSTS